MGTAAFYALVQGAEILLSGFNDLVNGTWNVDRAEGDASGNLVLILKATRSKEGTA